MSPGGVPCHSACQRHLLAEVVVGAAGRPPQDETLSRGDPFVVHGDDAVSSLAREM